MTKETVSQRIKIFNNTIGKDKEIQEYRKEVSKKFTKFKKAEPVVNIIFQVAIILLIFNLIFNTIIFWKGIRDPHPMNDYYFRGAQVETFKAENPYEPMENAGAGIACSIIGIAILWLIKKQIYDFHYKKYKNLTDLLKLLNTLQKKSSTSNLKVYPYGMKLNEYYIDTIYYYEGKYLRRFDLTKYLQENISSYISKDRNSMTLSFDKEKPETWIKININEKDYNSLITSQQYFLFQLDDHKKRHRRKKNKTSEQQTETPKQQDNTAEQSEEEGVQ